MSLRVESYKTSSEDVFLTSNRKKILCEAEDLVDELIIMITMMDDFSDDNIEALVDKLGSLSNLYYYHVVHDEDFLESFKYLVMPVLMSFKEKNLMCLMYLPLPSSWPLYLANILL